MTLDTTAAFGSAVAFVIPLVDLLRVMQREHRLEFQCRPAAKKTHSQPCFIRETNNRVSEKTRHLLEEANKLQTAS